MRIKLQFFLYAPISVQNPKRNDLAIFSKQLQSNLNRLGLDGIIKGVLIIEGDTWHVIGYDPKTNILALRGHLKSIDSEYLRGLVAHRWRVVEAGARHYEFSRFLLRPL